MGEVLDFFISVLCRFWLVELIISENYYLKNLRLPRLSSVINEIVNHTCDINLLINLNINIILLSYYIQINVNCAVV